MSWSRRRRLASARVDAVASMNSSIRKPWRRASSRMVRRWPPASCWAGGDAQVGDGFHRAVDAKSWFLVLNLTFQGHRKRRSRSGYGIRGLAETCVFSLQTIPASDRTAPGRVLGCLTPAAALGDRRGDAEITPRHGPNWPGVGPATRQPAANGLRASILRSLPCISTRMLSVPWDR